MKAFAGQRQQPAGGRGCPGGRENLAPGERRVPMPGALAAEVAGSFDTVAHCRRGLLVGAGEDVAVLLARDRDDQVDAVLDRSADLVPIRTQLARFAGAALSITEMSARARVGGADEHEVGRVRDRRASPSDRNRMLLERLPERLEMLPGELAELIEKEDALVGEADLTRLRQTGSAADQSGAGDAVVRCAEGRAQRGRRTLAKRASERVDGGDLERGVGPEVGEQGRECPREHGLTGAGWTRHQDVVTSGGGDLERPFCLALTANGSKIGLGRE